MSAHKIGITMSEGNRHDQPLPDRDYVGIYRPPEGPCAISNDPAEPSNPGDFYVCGIKAFQCPVKEDKVSTLTVAYDYDIYYNEERNFDESISFVEERILEGLANAMELDKCALIGEGRRLEFSPEQLNRFTGVYSDPVDEIDPRYDACYTDLVVDGTSCAPMQGLMHIAVSLTDEEVANGVSELPQDEVVAIRSSVYDYLESNMVNDAFVAPGFVEKIAFVGNRLELQPVTKSVRDSNPSSSSNSNLFPILGAVGGLLLLSVVVGILAKSKRKGIEASNRKQNVAVLPIDVEEDDDLYHKRRSRGKGQTSLVPGSLAFADSLALQPQPVDTTFISEDGKSEDESSRNSDHELESIVQLPEEDPQLSSPYSKPYEYDTPIAPDIPIDPSFEEGDPTDPKSAMEIHSSVETQLLDSNLSVMTGDSVQSGFQQVLDTSLEKVLITMRDDCCGNQSRGPKM